MTLSTCRDLPLILASSLALAAATSSPAQTTPAPASSVAPASPKPAAQVAPPDDLQWNAVGATAQCRDGTFFHGAPDRHACADHGGVRKLLEGRGQDLIR